MESIRVKITAPFELGYIVEDASGRRGQLRVPEMMPERLEMQVVVDAKSPGKPLRFDLA